MSVGPAQSYDSPSRWLLEGDVKQYEARRDEWIRSTLRDPDFNEYAFERLVTSLRHTPLSPKLELKLIDELVGELYVGDYSFEQSAESLFYAGKLLAIACLGAFGEAGLSDDRIPFARHPQNRFPDLDRNRLHACMYLIRAGRSDVAEKLMAIFADLYGPENAAEQLAKIEAVVL